MLVLSATQLSDLIGSIYDRAVDPQGWPETLRQMRGALNAQNAVLSLVDVTAGQFLLNFADNLPSLLVARLDGYGAEAVELWGGERFLLEQPLDEPVVLSRARSLKPIRGNAYQRDCAQQGLLDAMVMGLTRDGGTIGTFLFGRDRKTGCFGDREIALARLLAPHAQRAIAFSQLFELSDFRARAFETALDAVGAPTLLVSADAEVIHANAAALSELERGALLRTIGRRIVAADARDQAGLRAALATARERPDAHPKELTVAIGRTGRQLKLLPLPRLSDRARLLPAAAAIVLTPSPSDQPVDPAVVARTLIERHGLTRAESLVALEVAKGDGRLAAAERLGISGNTVRTHLSAVFSKLGINRQAQLADFMRGGDAPGGRA